jgi:hypothetical protein
MKFHGVDIVQGSNITNLVVDSGTQFPASPDSGELFYRTDTSSSVKGLYIYVTDTWSRISTETELIIPKGATLPSTPAEGQLFYLSTDTASEGLYTYDAEDGWQLLVNTRQPSTRYLHTQSTTSTTWTVTHNLALPSPFIAGIDCFLEISEGVFKPALPADVTFTSTSALSITWSTTQKGYAIIRR